MIIFTIFFVTHKNKEKMNKEKTSQIRILCSSIKSSENHRFYGTEDDVRVGLWLINYSLK